MRHRRSTATATQSREGEVGPWQFLEEFQHPFREANQNPQKSIENIPPFEGDNQLVSLIGV